MSADDVEEIGSVISKGDASSAQQSLGDVAYNKLYDRIADGTWPARARLPAEAELATQLGVSRPIVRQALARLRDRGIIVSRQGSGSYVRELGASPNLQFPKISSVVDLDHFLVFRAGVEGEAAAAAALSRTEATLADVVSTGESRLLSPEADFEFHLAVATASGNPFYVNTLVSLKEQIVFGMRIARTFSGDGRVVESISEQHRAIVSAIVAGNSDEARQCMRNHLNWARRRILTGALE